TGTQPTVATPANGILAIGKGDIILNISAGSKVQVLQTAASPATPLLATSWGINAQSLPAGCGVGGAVTIDVQGAVSGGGGILAIASGTDATDLTTVNFGAAAVV